MGETIKVKIGGEYACFTRPEFKVERVSYPCITPSAARGVLEAIYWKPEFCWEVREIHILKPIIQVSILRNEINTRQSAQTGPIFCDDPKRRVQRASLVLRDVEYVIVAEPVCRPHDAEKPKKHIDCFNRRLDRGQCHHTPYLGTREFAAWFERPTGNEQPADIRLHAGQMLFDIAYREDSERQEMCFYRKDSNGQRREVAGYAQAMFFPASIDTDRPGVLIVPPEKYREKYKLEGGL